MFFDIQAPFINKHPTDPSSHVLMRLNFSFLVPTYNGSCEGLAEKY
jgi:hypothetical protein